MKCVCVCVCMHMQRKAEDRIQTTVTVQPTHNTYISTKTSFTKYHEKVCMNYCNVRLKLSEQYVHQK
jgi:hypothetical protein